MHWIFQDNIFHEPFFDKMIDFLKRMYIPYEIVKAVPFTGEMIPEPSCPKDNAIFIGSYSFTNRALELGYRPGSWTNENYDYRVWSKEWGERNCLNGNAEIYKFGEVPFQSKPFFLRPCADDKLFTGHVIDWGDFKEWQKKVIDLEETYTDLDYHSSVLVSPVKKIESEWRFVVVDGFPITGSLYKMNDTPMQQEVGYDKSELYDYIRGLCSVWTPSEVFCIDICRADGKLYVVEMGNFNSAGLYHCDVQKIVISLENRQ